MENSIEIEKLKVLLSEENWIKFFGEALSTLENAKSRSDQKTIDIVFRLMRGSVFLLGQQFGDSNLNIDKNSLEVKCSVCCIIEENLIAFSGGYICSECAKFLANEFNNA